MRHSRVNSPRSNHPVLDPIVDDLIARAKPFGHLLDSQLLRPLELGRGNPIPATDPLDDFHRIRPAFGADLPLAMELVGDLAIGQIARQFSSGMSIRRWTSCWKQTSPWPPRIGSIAVWTGCCR